MGMDSNRLWIGDEPRTLAAGVYVPCWAFDQAFGLAQLAIAKGVHTVYQDIAVVIADARMRGYEEGLKAKP
jgi:hypothetical protein